MVSLILNQQLIRNHYFRLKDQVNLKLFELCLGLITRDENDEVTFAEPKLVLDKAGDEGLVSLLYS